MSTEPSAKPAGPPAASTEQQVKEILGASWFIHDLLLYGGTYLMLWAGDLPAGGGWDAAISVAPVALSALLRQILANLK